MKESTFTYASLFSGIGGFEQGLDSIGGQCVFASEIDKFASKAYGTLYGDSVLHGDIMKIDAKDVPDHDLLVGGFPCQAFSVAGHRKGFEDTRGTLFFEVARIAREKQPKAILLENVKGLVGHDKGRTLDTIVQTLNDIGYTVDFEVLNSKYFGVPQNRERIFIVAVRDDLVEAEPWIIEGNTVVPKGKRRISAYEGIKTFNFDWPSQEFVTTKLRDILETDVDEKYYLDDDKTAKLVAQLEAKNPDERMSRQAIETFNESEHPKEHGDMIQAYKRQHLKDGICPTLTTRPEGLKTASLPIVEGIAIKEATKKGYAIAEEGDSVNVQFPNSETRRGRVGKQIANTLEASSINQGVVESPPKYRIRKLTPIECFRLQGFPDESHQALVDAGISDSQRYKMAGNAVSVPVIEALGERLLPFLSE